MSAFEQASALGGNGATGNLQVTISTSLQRKLVDKAASEGVPLNELVGELLAEGLVLRAWEIMERKSTMRGPNSSSPQPLRNGPRPSNGPNKGPGGPRSRFSQNGGGGPRRNSNPHAILEDSANFIEYVRSQEARERRR